MLAIAAPDFHKPSETFVHDHVRYIAPGFTVLLCKDSREAERFGRPVLSDIGQRRSVLARAARSVQKRWFKGYTPALGKLERARVAEFLQSHNAEAVLAEFGPTGCLVAEACRQAAVPLFVHFHGYDASKLLRETRWVKSYQRMFVSAAGVIAPSRFLAEKIAGIGCPQEKLHVSYNGIDAAQFTPTQRVPGRVIAVGRLVEKKAPHLTIAAFGKIAARFPYAQLDIVGDGPLAERCRSLVCELGVETRVRFHGAQHSAFVAKLLASASLFVQHSITAANGDTEGFGISILEAMASCIPVVTTRHNGFVETVEDGVTGFLVDERDIQGMASSMAALLDHPVQAAKMGEAGRERVLAKFTIEKSSSRLRSIMKLTQRDTPDIYPRTQSASALLQDPMRHQAARTFS